jgi:hypothetical protein
MDRGLFVDRSAGERELFRESIQIYVREVTNKRPGNISRISEKARLERFMRDEPQLCAYAVAHLRPEHFIEYRDRRLTEFVTRGQKGGRGQYKLEKPKPGRIRKDGSPRTNAAKPKAPPKPPQRVKPGTVKRELNLLKRVIDYRKRQLGVLVNPLNKDDVSRPVVNDERTVRLDDKEITALIMGCYGPGILGLVRSSRSHLRSVHVGEISFVCCGRTLI